MILRKALVFATIYLIIAPRIHAQGTVGCSYPLGMNNGAITDSQLFASSVDRETSSAQHARLNQTSGDKAWCAKSLTRNPQLQINLIYPTLVTKLAISGRRQEYVSGLIIEIKTAPNTNYSSYNQGRVITVSPVAGIGIAYIDLVPSIFAYEILFTIVEHVGGAQCMGVELYGCYLMKGKVKYYNIQDGNDNHFYDYDYNGTKSTLDGIIYLSNGIGKLTDGTLGSSKPSSILSNEWIGWSSVIVSVPTLTFAFATEQIFYQVYIHCLISYPFTLFKYANLSFSNDSSEWTRPVIYYANKSPTITSEAFFITLKLHNETGRYIKLELAYSKSNAWIGLSEIWFMSREVNETSFNTITVPTSESRPTRTTLVSTTASTEKPRLTMKSTKPPTMATTATTRTVVTIGSTFTSIKSESVPSSVSKFITMSTSAFTASPSLIPVAVPTVIAFALVTIMLIAWFAYRRNLCPHNSACSSRISRNRVTLRRGKIIVKQEQDRQSTDIFSDSLKGNGNRNSRMRSPIPSYMMDQDTDVEMTSYSYPTGVNTNLINTAAQASTTRKAADEDIRSNDALINERSSDAAAGHSLTSLDTSTVITPASKTSSDRLRQSATNLNSHRKGDDENDAYSVILADDDYSSSEASSIFFPIPSTNDKLDRQSIHGGYQSDEDSHVTDELSTSSRDHFYNVNRQRSLRRSHRTASRHSLGNEIRKQRRHIQRRSSSRASLNKIAFSTAPRYEHHDSHKSVRESEYETASMRKTSHRPPAAKAPKLSISNKPISSSSSRSLRSHLPREGYEYNYESGINRVKSSSEKGSRGERRVVTRSATTAGTHTQGNRLYSTIGSRDQREKTLAQQLSASIGRKPSKSVSYKDQSAIMEYPISCLEVVKDIGEAEFITVHLAKAKGLRGVNVRYIALKKIKDPLDKAVAKKFFQEVAILNKIKHKNVTRLLAISTRNQVLATIIEYPEFGNLHQYLQQATNEIDLGQPGVPPISPSYLLLMAKQIAEGMQYLTSLDIVHRDLATRNCLVGSSYFIKVSNFGVVNRDFMRDYYIMEDLPPLPIRWMAPEAILEGDVTTSSDVWAFGITLWEILTFAKRPYGDKSDVEVLENIIKLYEGGENAVLLNQPSFASNECYKLMQKCWRLDPKRRPSFEDIVTMFS